MALIKNVAIIGAGGNLGKAVLPAFLEKTNVKITVVSRPESKSTFPSSVNVVRASVDDPASFEKAFQGQDAVLCLIATSEIPKEGLIVEAAAKAGVKWFVPSEFGHDTTDPKVVKQLPIFSGKDAVVEKLRSHESTMGWTGIVTGLFLDWGLVTGFLGYDCKNHAATIWDDGNHEFNVTNITDIAEALVTLLTNEKAREKAKNKTVWISSVRTNQNEILATVEKVTGTKWTVKNVDGKTAVEEGREKMAKGEQMGAFAVIQSIAFVNGGWRDWNDRAEEGRKILLPNGTESLEDTVKRVAQA